MTCTSRGVVAAPAHSQCYALVILEAPSGDGKSLRDMLIFTCKNITTAKVNQKLVGLCSLFTLPSGKDQYPSLVWTGLLLVGLVVDCENSPSSPRVPHRTLPCTFKTDNISWVTAHERTGKC